MLLGGDDETFFCYGYQQDNSEVLYFTSKERMSNGFIGAAFKKHATEIVNDCTHNNSFNILLPSFYNQSKRKHQSFFLIILG